MNLRNYVPKTRPALWTTMPGGSKPRRLAAQPPKAKPHRKRIAPVSKHRAGKAQAYRRRQPLYLAENPHCVACAKLKTVLPFTDDRQHRSESIHHVHGRLGPLLLDERHWLPVCAASHDFIHRNPAIARALGLLAQPGQWNKYEP